MKFQVVSLLVVLVCSGCRSPRTIMKQMDDGSVCFSNVVIVETKAASSETRTIGDYVQLGLARNPAVAEAQHLIDAIHHRVPQELALPDPAINTTTFLAPVETAAGRQAFALGVSQKFTNARRRATRAAMVQDEIQAAQDNLTQVELELAEKIRIACHQLQFIRKAIQITEEDIESLAQIAEVVLRQYEVKKNVTQQDVLNIQIEQSNVENQLTELQQKEKSYAARLARLVHLPPESDLPIMDELTNPDCDLNLESLTAQAVASRPELSAQLANIRRDEKRVDLANLQKKPDFTVGLNWIATTSSGLSAVANGNDAVLLGVGFNLPVNRDRIRAAVCEAKSATLASTSRYESLEDQIVEEVFDLIAKAESTQATLSLLQEDIIPKASRTLDLTIDEYANGDVQYVQLIENWRSLLRYRITESRLISDFYQTLASLSRSVGDTGLPGH